MVATRWAAMGMALWLWAAQAVWGAEAPVVDGVQSPAWLERASGRTPLAPGMRLAAGDTVVSGPGARVLLQLPDGSAVKLGANARFALERFSTGRDARGNLVTATLDVLRGAFRYTTGVSGRYRGRREVDIRVATITAGIRGTDVWAKADTERDVVCLIDGRISVRRGTDAPFVMDQPLSFYIAPRTAPPLPVQPVSPQQLEQWKAETEIAAETGAIRRGGRWSLELGEADDQTAALRIYDALHAAGYPARIHPVEVAGRIVYRIRISGLADEREARALADRVRTIPAVSEPRPVRG